MHRVILRQCEIRPYRGIADIGQAAPIFLRAIICKTSGAIRAAGWRSLVGDFVANDPLIAVRPSETRAHAPLLKIIAVEGRNFVRARVAPQVDPPDPTVQGKCHPHCQDPPSMTAPTVTPSQIRCALLCARKSRCSMCGTRPPLPPAIRCLPPTWRPIGSRSKPRRDCRARMCRSLSTTPAKASLPGRGSPCRVGIHRCSSARRRAAGLAEAGFELFQDVNSYAKAFGELVEFRRHTPSLAADEVASLIAGGANIRILDVRRFDEYATMNIPGSISVPGAELVLRAGRAAPDPQTTIIVNCAGRTRSIIGTQSLINAGVANKVVALRNGTIGWTLAGKDLEHGADRRGGIGLFEGAKAMPVTSPIAPASGMSAREEAMALERRRAARSIASTSATAKSMPPVTSLVFATTRAGSSSRRSTWRRRCVERASC